MSFDEVRAKHTERQLGMWLAWFRLEMDRPNRADYYQMQTACEVRRTGTKKPKDVLPEHFKITFKDKESVENPSEELPEGFPKRLTKESIAKHEVEMKQADRMRKLSERNRT